MGGALGLPPRTCSRAARRGAQRRDVRTRTTRRLETPTRDPSDCLRTWTTNWTRLPSSGKLGPRTQSDADPAVPARAHLAGHGGDERRRAGADEGAPYHVTARVEHADAELERPRSGAHHARREHGAADEQPRRQRHARHGDGVLAVAQPDCSRRQVRGRRGRSTRTALHLRRRVRGLRVSAQAVARRHLDAEAAAEIRGRRPVLRPGRAGDVRAVVAVEIAAVGVAKEPLVRVGERSGAGPRARGRRERSPDRGRPDDRREGCVARRLRGRRRGGRALNRGGRIRGRRLLAEAVRRGDDDPQSVPHVVARRRVARCSSRWGSSCSSSRRRSRRRQGTEPIGTRTSTAWRLPRCRRKPGETVRPSSFR